MRIAVTVLLGLAAAITGALIRSCAASANALSVALAGSWCGQTHAAGFASLLEGHCAGCGLIAAGLVLLVAALGMAILRTRREAAAAVATARLR